MRRRLKQLEEENAKLKKLLAEAMLDNAVSEGNHIKKVVTPAARRAAVTAAQEAHGISERRACSIIGADRSAMRYCQRRAGLHGHPRTRCIAARSVSHPFHSTATDPSSIRLAFL